MTLALVTLTAPPIVEALLLINCELLRIISEPPSAASKYIAPPSLAELLEKVELVAAKKELFNLRFQNATNQLDNTARIKEVRKNIARIQTVMTQKANAAE